MFSNGDRKMVANMTNLSRPNEEAISFLVYRVYRAMTEELPRQRSRVGESNSSNVEEELLRNFQIPRVGALQSPLYNPWVNYGKSGSGGKKGKLRSSSWKGKSAKESPHSISCKELVLLHASSYCWWICTFWLKTKASGIGPNSRWLPPWQELGREPTEA